MKIEDCFSPHYAAGRDRFLSLARENNAKIRSFLNNVGLGPHGEDYAADIAWFGPDDASKVFFCSSSMHGLEGPAGNAAQVAWLIDGRAKDLPPDTAVLLLHGLNAWGYANITRLTENNVDLNRNFLDFSKRLPKNPYYEHAFDLVRQDKLTPEVLADVSAEYERLKKEIGPGATYVAVNAGQYEDPEGISYGGHAPEFGHRIVRDEVLPQLKTRSHVGLLDWHTGVGDYMETAYLISGGVDSAAGARACDWWGEEKVKGWKLAPEEQLWADDFSEQEIEKSTPGQMYNVLPDWLGKVPVTGGIIEFGTMKGDAMTNLALVYLYERWMRFIDKGDRFAPEHKDILALAHECFVPADPQWRQKVVDEGPMLMNQIIDGLAKV